LVGDGARGGSGKRGGEAMAIGKPGLIAIDAVGGGVAGEGARGIRGGEESGGVGARAGEEEAVVFREEAAEGTEEFIGHGNYSVGRGVRGEGA